MCGRFTIAQRLDAIGQRFIADGFDVREFAANYNVPPTAKVPIMPASKPQKRKIEMATWGLKREWSPNIINLRVEKLLTGAFQKLLSMQRCLIPADGFYEWGTRNGKKFPMHFRMKGGGLFGFPGLYDEGNPKNFLFFTISPNELVAKIHDRMPAILRPQDEELWLDASQTNMKTVHKLLITYPAAEMEGWEVSPAVNTPKNNSAELLKPI